MKIVIVGPGALGCLLAATIAASGENEVLLLDHNHDRAALLQEQGISLVKDGQVSTWHVSVTASPADIGPADVIILATKSQAVATALTHILPVITEESLLVALQNGVLHLDILSEQLAVGQWAAGVTALGACLLAPGQVRYGGKGLTRLGFYPRRLEQEEAGAYLHQEKKITALAAIMNRAGLQTEVSGIIIDHIWTKLLVNVGINALTAIHNCANGDILARPSLKDKLTRAVMEGEAVAKALKIDVPPDIAELTLAVCRATAQNISSMLQDVRAKRPTEIDAINGALVAAASPLGIATPVNDELIHLIKDMGKRYSAVPDQSIPE